MPRKTRKVRKHFHGAIELDGARYMERAKYELLNANPRAIYVSKPSTGDTVRVGFPLRLDSQPLAADEYYRPLLVERSITVVNTDAPHICDWRCEGAFRDSECRCSCGGRNHGIKGKERGI